MQGTNVPALYLFTASRISFSFSGRGPYNGGRGRKLSSIRDFLFLVNLSSSRPRDIAKVPYFPFYSIDFARFASLASKIFMRPMRFVCGASCKFDDCEVTKCDNRVSSLCVPANKKDPSRRGAQKSLQLSPTLWLLQ